MTPKIVLSPFGKRWYVVTRYREREGIDAVTGEKTRYIVASVKHDVTDQMETILASHSGRKSSRRKSRRLAATGGQS